MTAKVISSIVEKKLENESIALNARRSHSSINPAMPVRVNIATTDDCNLRCPTCIFPDHGMHHELSLQDFKEFAKELFPLAREYHTTLLGEPLLTSYFKEIPHILQQYQMQMSLVTNGMLLTKDVSNLIMPVLRDIKFSFDGATKQTFERIRPRSNFETILENIKQFLRLRNSSPYRPTALPNN